MAISIKRQPSISRVAGRAKNMTDSASTAKKDSKLMISEPMAGSVYFCPMV